jgi:hypothetical protein
MAQYKTKVKLFLEANSKTWNDTKVFLQNNSDGNGDFISFWDYDIPQPTAEQLASYETEATKIENNNVIISARKQSYGTWQSQLEEIYDNGIDAWKTRIAQVKADNPKE